ncbi:hypothetical protein BDZ45DRAFT_747643 [Acephala macrosclerotiorum]|nr:hypothetical protein BDZ45DRAFT_747643 [Acephala macrosclerotiorum]
MLRSVENEAEKTYAGKHSCPIRNRVDERNREVYWKKDYNCSFPLRHATKQENGMTGGCGGVSEKPYPAHIRSGTDMQQNHNSIERSQIEEVEKPVAGKIHLNTLLSEKERKIQCAADVNRQRKRVDGKRNTENAAETVYIRSGGDVQQNGNCGG